MDLERPQPAGLDSRGARADFVLRELCAGIHREISEIARIPQHDRLHDAAVDVRLVDVRQREADDVDAETGLPHGFGGTRHGRRRNRHDQLDARIHLQNRLRLRERLVAIVVARPNRHERQPRITIGEPLLDELDPFVLIRRGEGAGDDGEFTALVQQPCGLVGQRVADAFGRGLVDEELARVRLRVRVPREHVDAASARLPQDGRDTGAILDRNGNDVDPPRNPVFDQLVLFRRIQAGGPVPDQIHVQVTGRFLGARAAAHKIRIALGLRHHRDDRAMPRRRSCTGQRSIRRTPQRMHEPCVGSGHDDRAEQDRAAQDGNLAVLHC